jgi:TRAP-type C4-dicarboxylate transport system permease small subunit
MSVLERVTRLLNRLLVFCGGMFLVGMILLTCANIACRAVWVPIRGTFELMGYFGAVVTAAALAFTQLNRGHIAVNVLINRFSSKTRRYLNAFNNAACVLFFAMLAWQIGLKAHGFMQTGEVSETLRVIFYPFTYMVAAGCGVIALVFAVDLLQGLRSGEGDGL